jgi:hypothetical protein
MGVAGERIACADACSLQGRYLGIRPAITIAGAVSPGSYDAEGTYIFLIGPGEKPTWSGTPCINAEPMPPPG